MSKQSVSVTILGKSYTITTDQDQSDIVKAAGMVDQVMQQIAEKAPSLPEAKVAVLASLHLANDVAKMQQELEDDGEVIKKLNTVLAGFDKVTL